MEASNRILTVSYGTFSCSLEGFDDPFTTLQMVAEYFRKLSAEDRFFGGEPQVPDTATIHKIAAAANPNKIDAEIKDSSIVLRQKPQGKAAEPDLVIAPTKPAIKDDAPVTVSDHEDRPEDLKTESNKNNKKRKNKNKRKKHKKHQRDGKGHDVKGLDDAGVFRTRRQSSGSGDDASDGPGAPDTPPKSVEETLAEIRVNVEKAEIDIIRSEAKDKKAAAPTLRLDKTMVAEPVGQEISPPTNDSAAATPDRADDVPKPVVKELPTGLAEAPEKTAKDDAAADSNDPQDPVKAAKSDTVLGPDIAGPTVDSPEPDAETTTLSAEAEADLAAALDDTRTDKVVKEEEPARDPAIDERRRQRRARAAALRNGSDVGREDAALDRLLQTTNSQMDGPERIRRRNALDQLKAAVAATEAEKNDQALSLETLTAEQQEIDALAIYRDDLKKAQRKSNIAAPSGAGSAPAAPAPTPLILVSEQRIDDPNSDEQPAAPIEHREVAETDGNLALKPDPEPAPVKEDSPHGIPASAFKESTSFRDFADQINAVTLQDMLEAAAAYTSIVEGRPRFSRAQVMSKLAKISTSEAFSKEAGLRSFGKLLREGKILRVQDGQFAISKSSRFSIASRYGT